MTAARAYTNQSGKRPCSEMASSTGTSSRKLVTLPLKRKIDCGGKRKKEIASDFDIAPNTILRDKERYRELFYAGTIDVNKKRARTAEVEGFVIQRDADSELLIKADKQIRKRW